MSKESRIQPGKKYAGFVVDGDDPKSLGRYRVYIPELSPGQSIPESDGFLVRNSKSQMSKSNSGSYGSNFPLQTQTKTGVNDNKGTQVEVVFRSSSPESGIIEKVTPDQDDGANIPLVDSQPIGTAVGSGKSDRDNVTVLAKSPDGSQMGIVDSAASEGPAAKSSGSVNLVLKDRAATLVMNDTGVNIYSSSGLGITVDGDGNIKISGSCKIQSDGDMDIYCGGSLKIYGSTIDILGSGPINIQGSPVNINSGAAQASTNEGENQSGTQNKFVVT